MGVGFCVLCPQIAAEVGKSQGKGEKQRCSPSVRATKIIIFSILMSNKPSAASRSRQLSSTGR